VRQDESKWEREASAEGAFGRIEEPEPRLWPGFFNSLWSVPPPFAATVAAPRFAMMSAILNVG